MQYFGRPNKSIKLVKIPKYVKDETELSFQLRDIGFKGGIETGWKRAKQLTTQDFIPIEDLRFMRNWYARHVYTSYPTFKKWVQAGKPLTKEWFNKKGIIAWLIWGGDSGLKWVNKMTPIINKQFNTEYTFIYS